MKNLLFASFLFVSLICKAQTESPLTGMTKDKWVEDIQFLNRVIMNEFQSFTPEVKDQFAQNLATLQANLDNYDNAEMAIKLSQLVAGLKDGHTELQILQRDIALDRLPLILYFFEEGLYLVGSHEEYREFIGQKVKAIGGKSVDEIFQLLKGLLTHDNDYEILHAGPGYLVTPAVLKYLNLTDNYENATITLIAKNGSENKLMVEAKNVEDYIKGPWHRYTTEHNVPAPISRSPREGYYWYQFMENENAMYFYFGAVSDQKGFPKLKKVIKDMFNEIDEVKPDKLIIDVRRNSGGNYNKSRPLIEEIVKRPWLNQEGRIYAISGRTTFSAAMVTCAFLKRETNAHLVGEPSRGHPNKTDNVEYINLPNSNLRLEYTTRIKKHWPELGSSNSIPMDKTILNQFADYANGVDATLKYILEENK